MEIKAWLACDFLEGMKNQHALDWRMGATCNVVVTGSETKLR
jgi:hypothetical protein